ncbi:MAG: hypothetical protein L3K13_06690 [Thermoplasmata archaeon]|nr:hypothetical protein [Thermoplasmata archaeon]
MTTARLRNTVRALTLAAVLVLTTLAAGGTLGAPAVASHAAPSGSVQERAASGAPHAAAHSSSTPLGSAHPHWSGNRFFTDVNVTFTIPGVLPNPDWNFTPTPNINSVPEWANGFWMNLTTDVPINYALVTIWGYTQYPAAGQQANLSQYTPNAPRGVPMALNSATHNHTASFYFNDYKNFWPGSVIFFNLSVVSIAATPNEIFSTQAAYYPYPGTNDLYTWQFIVGSPWQSNVFTNNIHVTSTPDVFSTPAYTPNPFQTIILSLSAFNQSGGPPSPIPAAIANVCVITPPNTKGGPPLSNCVSYDFAPWNSTVMSLPALGPYPGDNLSFTFEAWLPWQGINHAIDPIYSNLSYNFTWSKNGQWWHQSQGLLANAGLASFPNVLSPGLTILPTATPVNISIVSPTQNVTIGSAEVTYRFNDSLGLHSGVLPFSTITTNYSYVLIPGLPRGGTLTFYVIAKDVYGNPVSTGNYTYREKGALGNPGSASGSFFFEGLDVAGSGLVPYLNFTLSNATWSESGTGTSLGFGAPFTPGVTPYPTYIRLAYGFYTITVRAFGQVQNATVDINSPTPQTVLFYFASSAIPPTATSSYPTFTVAAVAGVGGAALAFLFIGPWFQARRKKAEEEQKRVTL